MAVHRGQVEPAARGDDDVLAKRGRGEDLPLLLAEITFSALPKQILDRAAFHGFDRGVGVDEFVSEKGGELSTDRGLSGSHETDEEDALGQLVPIHVGEVSRFALVTRSAQICPLR